MYVRANGRREREVIVAQRTVLANWMPGRDVLGLHAGQCAAGP
jgi:hypothetical protein